MRRLVCCLLLATPLYAAPLGYWPLSGDYASEVQPDLWHATGTTYVQGEPPAFDADVPAKSLWDGSTYTCLEPNNTSSLRFRNAGLTGGDSAAGSVVSIPDAGERGRPPSFTAELFVKVAQLGRHHALLFSKRRHDFGGATWSLSIDPAGRLMARFDVQDGQTGKNGVDWNLTLGAGSSVNDGEWHHAALTFDHETLTATVYLDYVPSGRRRLKAPLVYDDELCVLGRGLDGWLDEVRLSSTALHPEQFVRATQFFSDLKPRVSYVPMLDQTPTRVQTDLKLDWPQLGTLKPKSVHEISTSRWALGCETLDRDLADYEAYKPYLEPLGIQRIRLQGGWRKTEQKQGVYDFVWLDQIVDDALGRGLRVCLETSYGNPLYQANAAGGPGGILPAGDECLAAWDRWVEAMVKHYAPKGVHDWMMFNEPNLRKENTAEDTAVFNLRTAKIIKQVDPTAKIAGLVSAGTSYGYLRSWLETLQANEGLGFFEWLVYHGYSANPDSHYASVEKVKELVAELAPEMKLWQGEAGCASEPVQYALSGVDWTEISQAKWDARRMLGDLGHDVESLVFCISDISYHKDFISRYGLLKTNPDNSLSKVKVAYYTVQNVVSLFNDSVARMPVYQLTVESDAKVAWYAYRDVKAGLDLLAFWDSSGIPGTRCETSPATFKLTDARLTEPVWVDLLTGNVYAIPIDQIAREGNTLTLTDVPVYDSPTVLTDRSLLSYVPAREKN